MKKEKIILSFIAVLIGIVVAVIIFYFYQSTKKVPDTEIKKITDIIATPTPASSVFLTVDKPDDEQIVNTRTLDIKGKTSPDSKIVIISDGNQEGAIPASDGSFSTTITIGQGENVIEITAISPSGEQTSVTRVVTYSTEDF